MTALGDHALSPTAASAEGEDLLVTCGAGTDPGTWSNRDLEDLTLPRSLERVGDYALMNCGGRGPCGFTTASVSGAAGC